MESGDFSLINTSQVSDLVRTMSANPPSLVPGWKIGPNQTLAMLHKNQWFRGVAVAKTGDTFTVYRSLQLTTSSCNCWLIPLPFFFCFPAPHPSSNICRVDLGDILNVPKASLRPLPSAYCRCLHLDISNSFVIRAHMIV